MFGAGLLGHAAVAARVQFPGQDIQGVLGVEVGRLERRRRVVCVTIGIGEGRHDAQDLGEPFRLLIGAWVTPLLVRDDGHLRGDVDQVHVEFTRTAQGFLEGRGVLVRVGFRDHDRFRHRGSPCSATS